MASHVQLSGASTDGAVRRRLNAAVAFAEYRRLATDVRRYVAVHRQLGVDVVRALVAATVAVDAERRQQNHRHAGRRNASDHQTHAAPAAAIARRRRRRRLFPGCYVTRRRRRKRAVGAL